MLIDAYDVYQHLMSYWAEVMQDDAYMISLGGWKAETARVLERKKGKDGKETVKDKGWACDLVPKELIVARYFAADAQKIVDLEAERERAAADAAALEEEHGSEDGLFAEFMDDGELSISANAVKARLREIKSDRSAADERKALTLWLQHVEREVELKKAIKAAEAALDAAAYAKYPKLKPDDVKALVVDDKWMASLEARIGGETARVAQRLTRRVKELGDRYSATLPDLKTRVGELEKAVTGHLAKMGFAL